MRRLEDIALKNKMRRRHMLLELYMFAILKSAIVCLGLVASDFPKDIRMGQVCDWPESDAP